MSDKAITKFALEVINKFNKQITDQIFLMIENDRQLMQKYLRLVSNEKLDTVNQMIGKIIRKKYGLDNADRNYKPKSKLIKSHQEF